MIYYSNGVNNKILKYSVISNKLIINQNGLTEKMPSKIYNLWLKVKMKENKMINNKYILDLLY